MTEEKPRFGQQTRTLEEQLAFTDEAALKLADEGIREARLEGKYPLFFKLDKIAQEICDDWHQAHNTLFLEFAKSIAKESTPNNFDDEDLWADYILKKAKWDFVSEQLDMYEPTDEEDYQRTDHLPWEIKDDTN